MLPSGPDPLTDVFVRGLPTEIIPDFPVKVKNDFSCIYRPLSYVNLIPPHISVIAKRVKSSMNHKCPVLSPLDFPLVLF